MSLAIFVPRVEGYAFQRWADVKDFPDAALEVELAPPCEAQFARAHKHVKPWLAVLLRGGWAGWEGIFDSGFRPW
jgi:hypothetical protein